LNIILIIIAIYIILEINIFLFLKKYNSIKWLIFNKNIKFDIKKFNYFKKNIYNEKLGWDYKFIKGKQNFISKKGFRKSIYSNRNNNILAFGDSYTFCRQVENSKTWEELISKKKRIFVSNFGVGNYGLDQAYLKFKTINKKRENKIVIFGFVPETICRIQSSWKNYTEFGNIHGFKPSVELKNGNINFRKNFLKKKHNFSNLKTVIKNINKYDRFYKEKFLKYNFSFPYVLSFAKNFIFNFQIFKKVLVSKKNQVLLEEEIFPIIMKNNIKLSHSLYNENYSKKLMQTLISHISNDLKKQKLICYFVVFPQLFDLKLDTRNNYQNFFRNIKNKNIIDLTTLFLKSKNFKNLYTNDKYGGHLSNKGNDLVAKILNNIINKNK